MPRLRATDRRRAAETDSEGQGRMEVMRQIAYVNALRACGFGSLAIFTVMVGLSFEPRAAFEAGGILTLIMTAILMFKAREARTKNYRRTELWLYLPEEHRPPAAIAQRVSSALLRETYLVFAQWSALIAIVMWAIALSFAVIGF